MNINYERRIRIEGTKCYNIKRTQKNNSPIYIADNFLEVITVSEINNLLTIYECLDDKESRGLFKYMLNVKLKKLLKICNGMCS